MAVVPDGLGTIVTMVIYYPWAKATNRPPPGKIYPKNTEAVLSHS
jgi:hypothetical protein